MTEQIELQVSSGQALKALNDLNKQIQATEGGIEGANAELQASFDKLSQFVVSSSDRSVKALNRHVEAVERQTAAYNRSPIEKINAQRDAEIKKIQQTATTLDQQAAAIDRVNGAYNRMIVAEEAASKAGTASTKQVQALEKALETGSLNSNKAAASFLVNIKGIGPALSTAFQAFSAVAFASVIVEVGEEAHKLYVDIRDYQKNLAISAVETNRGFRSTRDELIATGNKLQDTIAKLEKKPRNAMKEAIDEARQAADGLSDALDQDLKKIEKSFDVQTAGFLGFLRYAKTDFGLGRSFVPKELQDDAKRRREIGLFGNERYDEAIDKARASGDDQRQKRLIQAQNKYNLEQSDAQLAAFEKAQAKLRGRKPDVSLFGGTLTQEQIDQDNVTASEAVRTARFARDNAKQRYQNSLDQAKVPGLENNRTAADYTEKLQRELAKSQHGELEGLEKINAAQKERLRQLVEEGQLNSKNKSIIEEIRKAEIARYQKEGGQRLSENGFKQGAESEAQRYKNQVELRQNQRRLGGIAFGETDIQETYGVRQKAIQAQEEADNRHISRLFAEHKLYEAIEAVQTRTAEKGRTQDNAETERTKALQELAQKRQDLQDKLADQASNFRGERRKQATEAANQQALDDLSFSVKMRKEIGHNQVGNEAIQIGQDHQDRDNEAKLVRQQTLEKVNAGRLEAEDRLAKYKGKNAEEELKAEAKLEELHGQALKAEDDYRRKMNEADREAQLQTIALWNKHYDEIKGQTEALLHTAFTNPKKFGEQFSTTIRDAALKPIENRLSSMISTGLTNTLFGKRPASDTKLTDLKGIGVRDNSLQVWVTNLPGAASFQRLSGGNAYSDSGAPAMPSLSSGTSSLIRMMSGGGFFGAPSTGSGGSAVSSTIHYGDGSMESFGGGSAATPSFSGGGIPGLGGGGSAGGLLGGIARVLGGGGSPMGGGGGQQGGGGFGGLFGGGSFMDISHNLGTADAEGNVAAPSFGNISGVGGMAGGLMMAGGMALAQRGLLGADRGTGKGILEGAGGGALIGFKYGGPIGAAIGAAVGAGIGVGEKLAGVESPQNEAKRLVKQHYGLNIDSSTANAIVQIADSKYGKKVSLAVMSPEVQQFLQLYAASTGQKVPTGVGTPRGAAISENSGRLSQDPTYLYGSAYTYGSKLPTSGGQASTQWGGGNSPVNLSLNINGAGAANFLKGSVVTSDYVQSQFSNAQQASNGRVQNSALMQVPGLVQI